MSQMRWKDLRDIDFSLLHSLAEQFDVYIDASIEQTETITEDVVKKHLGVEHYESQTADDVRAQANLLADSFQDDLHEYAAVKIKATLEDAHDELTTAQADMNDLLDTMAGKYKVTGPAHDHGLEISDELAADITDLKVSSALMNRAGVTEADLASDFGRSESRQRLIGAAETEAEEFAGTLRAIMARAHNAEETAAAILRSVIDDPADQPPPLGTTYDDLIDGFKEENATREADFLSQMLSGDPPATPEALNSWWNGLSDEEQKQLIDERPELVGPTDGLPTDVRDQANRNMLDRQVEEIRNDHPYLEDEITEVRDRIAALEESGGHQTQTQYGDHIHDFSSISPTQEYLDLQAELEELEAMQSLVDLDEAVSGQSESGQDYFLLGYDTKENGGAIVAVGNPDTADNTAVYVPGTFSTLDNFTEEGGALSRADSMAYDATRWGAGEETAVVAWLDYNAPQSASPTEELIPEALWAGPAEDGAETLNRFVHGLDASHDDSSRGNTTLVGHSYGTRVIGEAAQDPHTGVDQIIAVASPGLGVEDVSGLAIDSDKVWATTAEGDSIQMVPEWKITHSTDPTNEEFSANVFESDAVGSSGDEIHGGYWKEGNSARQNMAHIITGQNTEVETIG